MSRDPIRPLSDRAAGYRAQAELTRRAHFRSSRAGTGHDVRERQQTISARGVETKRAARVKVTLPKLNLD